MIDEIFDRTYQNGRTELNAGLDRLFKEIGRGVENTFTALHRIEFDAPWRQRSRKTRRA
jgi:hypothetical protein